MSDWSNCKNCGQLYKGSPGILSYFEGGNGFDILSRSGVSKKMGFCCYPCEKTYFTKVQIGFFSRIYRSIFLTFMWGVRIVLFGLVPLGCLYLWLVSK